MGPFHLFEEVAEGPGNIVATAALTESITYW
jgi:hypothetical protein